MLLRCLLRQSACSPLCASWLSLKHTNKHWCGTAFETLKQFDLHLPHRFIGAHNSLSHLLVSRNSRANNSRVAQMLASGTMCTNGLTDLSTSTLLFLCHFIACLGTIHSADMHYTHQEPKEPADWHQISVSSATIDSESSAMSLPANFKISLTQPHLICASG